MTYSTVCSINEQVDLLLVIYLTNCQSPLRMALPTKCVGTMTDWPNLCRPKQLMKPFSLKQQTASSMISSLAFTFLKQPTTDLFDCCYYTLYYNCIEKCTCVKLKFLYKAKNIQNIQLVMFAASLHQFRNSSRELNSLLSSHLVRASSNFVLKVPT